MNSTPYPFQDFLRAKHQLQHALLEHHEPFALLSGDTGTGKTALLRVLCADIDRSRQRLIYFAQASQLSPTGLIKVIAETLRVPTSLCHALSLERILRVLTEDPRTLLLWLDEAHELPESTLCQARTLGESNLLGSSPIQILLIGLPKLRGQLQAFPALWRRFVVREEITGLLFEELNGFLEHHFSSSPRLCEQGLSTLFEHAKGVPGLLLPMYRTIIARASSDNASQIDPTEVEDTLQRWDLA